MKKLIVTLAVVLSLVGVVHAQEGIDSLKKSKITFSGNLQFSTKKNSTFTGGTFNDSPALSATATFSLKDFSLSVTRCSDLLDHTSGANLFAFTPAWSKQFGKYSGSSLDVI